ncbi:MAG: alcohol dehydrogenase catalytic domain-containing protein [Pseudomonadota bacterium]|nr:alcohol dehydrogenase catalytic domain-containing protein [Pseudomonadota bacterium]
MVEKADAAVLTEPRNFSFCEFDIPEIGPDDAILRVEAAGLCGTDYEQYAGHLTGTPWDIWPIIPGHEIFGWIDRVGAEAAKHWNVKEGDRVVVEAIIPCGHCFQCAIGSTTLCQSSQGYGLYASTEIAPSLWGGYATHMYIHPKALLHKVPSNIPTDILSLFNPLSNGVRWAYEEPNTSLGETVVIEGPGQRGLLSVVAAREAGAGRIIVTGTGRDKARLELALRLGADASINVDEEDAVARVHELTDGRKADVVVEVSAGATQPVVDAVDMVRPGGRIVLAGLKSFKPVPNLITDKIVINEIKIMGVLSAGWPSIEKALDILSRRGDDLKPLCSHMFPLEDADKAVRALGREFDDGTEVVHIALDMGASG